MKVSNHIQYFITKSIKKKFDIFDKYIHYTFIFKKNIQSQRDKPNLIYTNITYSLNMKYSQNQLLLVLT